MPTKKENKRSLTISLSLEHYQFIEKINKSNRSDAIAQCLDFCIKNQSKTLQGFTLPPEEIIGSIKGENPMHEFMKDFMVDVQVGMHNTDWQTQAELEKDDDD